MGNVVANAQAFVAKAFLNGDFQGSSLDFTRLNITQEVLDFVEGVPGQERLASLVPLKEDYFCNGDSMFHVNKGVIAFKMDAAQLVRLRHTSAQVIENLGDAGSDACGAYDKSHPQATLYGYGGAAARGYTFAGSSLVLVSNSHVIDLSAKAGSATAFDILTDSRFVWIFNSHVQKINAGWDFVPSVDSPTAIPRATAFHISPDAKYVNIMKACGYDLNAYGSTDIVDDESRSANIRKLCKQTVKSGTDLLWRD